MDKKYCTLVGFQGPKPAFAHIEGELDPKLFEITNHISFDVACIFDGKISPMTWMRPIDLTSEIGREYLKLGGK